jgi:hypothetical protein
MRRACRLGAVAIVVVFTLGLCVHYGVTYDENWPHPTGEQLAEDPGEWDGEQVLLFGTVETIGEDQFTMTVETDAGEVARIVEVHGAAVDAEVGGVVQVYGTLSDTVVRDSLPLWNRVLGVSARETADIWTRC